MSRNKGVDEVVSVIISLVNIQQSCLVGLLRHRQPTEILENFKFFPGLTFLLHFVI